MPPPFSRAIKQELINLFINLFNYLPSRSEDITEGSGKHKEITTGIISTVIYQKNKKLDRASLKIHKLSMVAMS